LPGKNQALWLKSINSSYEQARWQSMPTTPCTAQAAAAASVKGPKPHRHVILDCQAGKSVQFGNLYARDGVLTTSERTATRWTVVGVVPTTRLPAMPSPCARCS
jgi:hypothetical protein